MGNGSKACDIILPLGEHANTMLNPVMRRYSKQGLWSLFLICAFPLHLWTLILVFRDMSWVIERTNAWDAVGVASYGLVFALAESIIIFVAIALLGLLTPKQWDTDRRVAFLSLLVIITGMWGIFGQSRYVWNWSLPLPILQFLAQSNHPFRFLYAMYLAVVIPTVLLPVYVFVKSKKSTRWMKELMERLSTLTAFYLVFDVIGLVIVIVRNLS